MSKIYDQYLEKHIHAVKKCYELLTSTGLKEHDASKYDVSQYVAYDNKFYPEAQDIQLAPEVVSKAYDMAWNEHQKKEKHHWQYWVLIGDSGYIRPLEMPERYVYEMVADWGAFAFLKHDGNDIIDWYKKHRDIMMLNAETKKLVDQLVPRMAKAIDTFYGVKR